MRKLDLHFQIDLVRFAIRLRKSPHSTSAAPFSLGEKVAVRPDEGAHLPWLRHQ
jgi:hypothetical protein